MTGIARRLASPIVVVLAVATIGLFWIMATPPSAGPDEQSHIVRGAALVRGMLDGERLEEDSTFYYFERPAEVGFPAPNCFAFQPDVPATCATSVEVPSGDAILFTRSSDYPIWGHLLPGVGTLVPGETGNTLARFLDGLIPIILIGASAVTAARRGQLAAGATLLAITPMAWFTLGVVNPSGYVIAGGIGLWTALITLSATPPGRFVSSRSVAWLGAVSWASMVLPRRDGLVYAALILSLVILFWNPDLRRVGRGPQIVVGVSTLATLAWATTSDTTSSKALFVAPLAPLAAVGLRRLWRSNALRTTGAKVAAVGGIGVVALLGLFVVMDRRAGGFDRAALRAAMSRSGTNLRQAIGDLGWLDTPVPDSAVFLWLLALGALAGVALLEGGRRVLVAAAAAIGAAVVTAWTLTMLQNDPLGTYWQGRYYLPLLVGVPIILGVVPLDAARARRVGVVVGGAGLIVANVAIAQMMRRFAVGTSGSLSPFDWDTYGAPLPPVVILVAHVAASVALLLAVLGLADAGSRPTRGVNIVGYHHVASGLGEIAREIHRSLDAAGVPCTAVDVMATDSPHLRAPAPSDGRLYDRTIAVVPALQLPSAMHALPDVVEAQEWLVGYFFWELDVVPETHQLGIDTVDEIWTPTDFVDRAYASAAGETPVRLMPTRIAEPATDDDAVARWRAEFHAHDAATGDATDDGVNLSDDAEQSDDLIEPFVFLTSLDLFSVVERKNPVGAIEAFRRAFGETDPNAPGEHGPTAGAYGQTLGERDVRLVVKTINGDRRPDDLAAIVEAAGGDPRITVLDRLVDERELDAMIAAADCFVSLHRSEGLGLHLAQAMWLGTPVIATRWSGNLDIMADDCAALIDAELITVEDGRGAYPGTAHWADPDLDQAASWMRRLVDDPDEVGRLTATARTRMQAQPSRAEVGQAMAAVLEAGAVAGAGSPEDFDRAGGSTDAPEGDARAATRIP